MFQSFKSLYLNLRKTLNTPISKKIIGTSIFIIVIFFFFNSSFQKQADLNHFDSSKHKNIYGLIADFSQTKKKISIKFNKYIEQAGYVVLKNVPENLNIVNYKSKQIPIVVNNNVITLSLESEPTKGEYSIFLFLGEEYVELVRKSEKWLKSAFSYDRPGGSTVLGRRSEGFLTSINDKIKPPFQMKKGLEFSGIPDPIEYVPSNKSDFLEVRHAQGLLEFLYSKIPIFIGPTNKSYSQFLNLKFEKKLEILVNGDFPLTCQIFRDLFLHASKANNTFKIRAVEAYNYYPQIPKLISFGHSLTEIWIEKLQKWVIFDPWLAIMVENDGILIGAEELKKSLVNEKIKLVPLLKISHRKYKKKNGQVINFDYSPFFDIHLNNFICDEFCYPGYREYFKNIFFRNFRVVNN